MLYCLNNPSKFRKNFGLTNSEQLNCSVDVHTERPEKLALWASVRRIFTIHNGYPHLPIHVESTALSLKTVSLSVFIAISAFGASQISYAFPAEAAFTQNTDTGVWSFGKDSGFDVSTGESNQIPVYVTIPSGADPFDNSGAWLWSYSSSANKDTASSLSLVISKNQAWNTASNKYIDLTSTTMWIAAGLKSDFFINNASINSPDAKKEYIGGLSEAPESGHYSETTNGNTLKSIL